MRGSLKVALLAGALILGAATWAQAKGTPNVEFTVHNLSVTMGGADNQPGSAYVAGEFGVGEEQICIFCHTPHGGKLNGPLWNHSLPGVGVGVFTHYNSASLSTALRNLSSTRAVNNESLLCMSCHDGSIAVNRVINPSTSGQPQTPSGDATIIPVWNTEPPPAPPTLPNAQIGTSLAKLNASDPTTGDLTDDHPISFSYYDVRNELGMDQELRSVAQAETAGVRFFGPDAATGKRVECSSCHDPHVDYDQDLATQYGTGHVPASPLYDPFLIMPNTNSDLCLACHIK